MTESNKDKWVLKSGNKLFFCLLSLFLCILAVLSVALRKESEMARSIVLSVMCAVTTVGFFVYKYFLSIDDEYSLIRQDSGTKYKVRFKILEILAEVFGFDY